MNINSEIIGKGISLITIPAQQYKTNLISIYFKRPLTREEVTKNSLIPYVLRAGSHNYHTQSLMVKELQRLYGSSIGVEVNKVGERQILSFKLAYTNEKYLDEKIAQDAMNILLDMIFNPYTEKGAFKESYVEVEKEILGEAILSKINNKAFYAVERMTSNMCQNEPFSIPEDGYIEDLKDIKPDNLFAHYQQIIRNSEIDIVLSGDIDKDMVKEAIKQRNLQRDENLIEIPDEAIYFEPKEVKHITESLNVTQGKLVMGYRTNIDPKGDLSQALSLYGVILGAGVSSKLFTNVREKHSLCYAIGASLEKMKSLMIIQAGIEISDYEKAKEKILEQVDAMTQGDITETELINAQKFIINGIKSVSDYIWSMSDYIYGLRIQGSEDTPEQIIERISQVTLEQIAQVSKKVKLDTIYFLTNSEQE